MIRKNLAKKLNKMEGKTKQAEMHHNLCLRMFDTFHKTRRTPLLHFSPFFVLDVFSTQNISNVFCFEMNYFHWAVTMYD